MKDYLEVLASSRLNIIIPLYVKKDIMMIPTMIEIIAPKRVLKDS
jgi:hypothetical protein